MMRRSSSASTFCGSAIATSSVVVDDRDRHERVALGEFLGNRCDGVRLGMRVGEVDVLDADLLRHDREDRALGRVAQVDEHATERTPRRAVDLKRVVELPVGDDAGPHQQLAEPLSCFRHLTMSCSNAEPRAISARRHLLVTAV